MYFVCRFSYYVLRNRMPFVCSEYVEQISFVWTVRRLFRHSISYVIGVFETQVGTLFVVVPVQLISLTCFTEEWLLCSKYSLQRKACDCVKRSS